MIRMIAAVTKHNVIGRDNKIPWKYPGDLRFFKEKTEGSTVVMGRKTWESIGESPLPNRTNIVVSKSLVQSENKYYPNRPLDRLVHCWNFEEKHKVAFVPDLEIIMDTFPITEGDKWIIGGGSIYQQGLKYADEIILTVVPDDIPVDGSILFPILSETEWEGVKIEFHPYEDKLIVWTFRRIKNG